jgi:uncharacterized protein DUF6236
MAAIGLYYPWMHFQDPSWLKLALLTWDRLYRVRPAGIDDRDTALVRQIRAESELIQEATPGADDLESMHRLFADLVAEHVDELRARYDARGQAQPGLVATPWSNAPWSQAPPVEPVAPELLWVFYGDGVVESKISINLLTLLQREGLAATDPRLPGWVGMASRLGEAYLVTLADVMARANRLSPVTDDPRVHRALGSERRLTEMLLGHATAPDGAVNDPTGAYVELSLRAVLTPERLADVPVAKLLAFRERHAAELAAFREHVAGLGAELTQIAEVANLDIARAHLSSLYRTRTRPALEELRRALRAFGIESGVGVLTLKADLGLAAAFGLAGTAAAAGHPVTAGAALTLAMVPYSVSRFGAWRRLRSTSPVAYLLSAGRELA